MAGGGEPERLDRFISNRLRLGKCLGQARNGQPNCFWRHTILLLKSPLDAMPIEAILAAKPVRSQPPNLELARRCVVVSISAGAK